ncbi:MAG TPA: efflux RND transporter periplasmic adaptor subunit [Caulobacteraceae bacterium]|nr:efflux RND transporter periplasmic adaptor subunit [Caulobacteraceae bacterium]
MIRRHFFLIGAVALVLLMGIAGGLKLAFGKEQGEGGQGGGRGGPGGGGGRGAVVTPYTVAVRPFTDTIEVLGQAKANQSVVLTSNSTEMIRAVHFASGQAVRAGAVLVTLDAREQEAGVLQARTNLDIAKRDWDRWRTLAQKGVAPRAQADQYEAAYKRAAAALQAEQARRGDRVIRAPFSGVIGLSDAAPGMLVNPGAPIATLNDLSVIKVDFQVPERYVSLLRAGAALEARADSYPDTVFQGRVAVIDAQLDPNTRALTARAEFSNPGGRIKPGMMLRVGLSQGTRAGPAIPESAVIFEGDSAAVYAVKSDPKRGMVAERREITVGAREGGQIEVVEGLKPGERIVADGVNRVQPNQPLRFAGEGGGRGRGGGATKGGGS